MAPLVTTRRPENCNGAIYSQIDPRTKKCNLVINPNCDTRGRSGHAQSPIEDGESDAKAWMPLLVTGHQQESTL